MFSSKTTNYSTGTDIYACCFSFQARTVWPERFHLWSLQKWVDKRDWLLNLVLCFRSSPSVKHSLCSWQINDLDLSAILCSQLQSFHKCFYISIFTLLHLQRPRLQHAGLGDKESPAPLPPCSSTWCLHRELQDPCWHRQVSASRGLFKTAFYPLPDRHVVYLHKWLCKYCWAPETFPLPVME